MALTASERVKLLKEIATRLEDEGWALIDLTLTQFGLPTQDRWPGTTLSYILDMTGAASDPVLVDLARHVGAVLDTTATAPGIDPPFWRTGLFRLFITHLAVHKDAAALLQKALLSYGITAFVAHSDIHPTLEWQTQIETALATCNALVALMHPKFHESSWTDQEIGFAMGRRVPVFSVRLGQDPYGFIGRFQAFAGSGKTAKGLARELFDAYRSNKQTQVAMAAAVISLFEQSDTFAEAKERVGLLEGLTYWEASFSSRIAVAVKTNSQIDGSWHVPDRVEALVKKWA